MLDNDGGGCSGVDNGNFTISGSNLLSAVMFDYEIKTDYTICVKSNDSGSLTIRKQFIISVQDSNDPPTGISISDNSLAENLPAATIVGILTTSDINPSNSHTYGLINTEPSCSGADNGYFTIENQNLRTAQVLDYETKSSYEICIQTTDNGSPNLSFSKAFKIILINENEAPVNINLSNNTIAENLLSNSLVGDLSTVDFDSTSYTYSLINPGGACSGVDNTFFTISGSSLRSNVVFDYETAHAFDICIRSTDDGGLSFDKQFIISITDVDETSPVCIISTPVGTDLAPPPNGFVSAIYPLNNATDVEMSLSYIEVHFNQPMETGTGAHGVEKTGNYELRKLSNNNALAITEVIYDNTTYIAQVYFNKSTNWSNQTVYEFIVKKNIENDPACGIKQDVNVRIQFTTGSSAISSVKNEILSFIPVIGLTNTAIRKLQSLP